MNHPLSAILQATQTHVRETRRGGLWLGPGPKGTATEGRTGGEEEGARGASLASSCSSQCALPQLGVHSHLFVYRFSPWLPCGTNSDWDLLSGLAII